MNREELYRESTENPHPRVDNEAIDEASPAKELPPRGDLHRQKTKKEKWKFNYPIIRLLVLFFILLPITIYSINSFKEKNQLLDSSNEKVGFENVVVGKMEETTNEEPEPIETPAEEEKIEKEKETDENEGSVTGSDGQEEKSAPENKAEPEPIETPISPEKPASDETTQHTVTSGDTLYSIAMKYYKSKNGIEIIKQANNLKNNGIQNGQVLMIPHD
jgi:LysM repeat protein